MQAIAIPGYRGHIAGKDSPTRWSHNALPPCLTPDSRLLPRKVSENLHGGTFGSENHLATQSLPLRPGLCFRLAPCFPGSCPGARSMRRTWSEPFRVANHDPVLPPTAFFCLPAGFSEAIGELCQGAGDWQGPGGGCSACLGPDKFRVPCERKPAWEGGSETYSEA